MCKVAILQSNYIPWKGVFDIINKVDKFVFLEDVQFTKRDWRTRNKIKTVNGDLWLSIPVKKAPRDILISDIEISQDENWQNKHYINIRNAYLKAPYFEKYHYLLEEVYLRKKWNNLSEFNIYVTKLICNELGINSEFFNSVDLDTAGSKDDKLIEICKKVGGDYYLSGPSAKGYIVPDKFKNNDIKLAYIEYNYPEYNQLHGKFNHFVSVLDVLFNCGENSGDYIFSSKIEEV